MNKRILIITEDDNNLRKEICDVLKWAGFQVIKALDGEDGLRKIKLLKPAVLILGLMLSKMPGEQVLKKLGENDLIKKIPVIVVSRKCDEADIRNCLDQLGVKGYLCRKDIHPKEMIKKINKILKMT